MQCEFCSSVKFPKVIHERLEAEQTGERSSRLMNTTIMPYGDYRLRLLFDPSFVLAHQGLQGTRPNKAPFVAYLRI